jgi:Flp pilus assembly protein TadG
MSFDRGSWAVKTNPRLATPNSNLRTSNSKLQKNRRGVAAVELALVSTLFVVPLLIGVWELGRMIQVQQILCNSARDGARLAAQGYTVNTTGAPTQIMASTGSINVHDAIYQYLVAAGLTNLTSTDVAVTFTFLTPTSAGVYPTDPYLGEKGELFQVTVTIPWSKVQWVNLGIIKPTSLTYTVTWQMLVDDPFTVDDTLPTW